MKVNEAKASKTPARPDQHAKGDKRGKCGKGLIIATLLECVNDKLQLNNRP